jgi:hypothetical protein
MLQIFVLSLSSETNLTITPLEPTQILLGEPTRLVAHNWFAANEQATVLQILHPNIPV